MTFLALELAKFISFWILAFVLGNWVYKYKIKVNYTRKIHHFFLLFFPIFFIISLVSLDQILMFPFVNFPEDLP